MKIRKYLCFILLFLLISVSAMMFSSCKTETPFKVGVLLLGVEDDSGYSYEHVRGIRMAQAEANLSNDDVIIIENVPDTDDVAVKNHIDSLINNGCNFIIGTSYGFMTAMKQAALQYPEIIFTHATGSMDTFGEGEPGNLNHYFGRIYQAWYLAGIVAGLSVSEQENIGYISSFGNDNGEASSAINAFALGVQTVNLNSQIYVKVLDSWYNPTKETLFAEELINTHNCQLIVYDTDTANPSIVARDAGKKSIGYNSDMSKLREDGDNSVLTSVLWNWGAYYTKAFKIARSCFDANMKFVSIEPWRELGNVYGDYTENLYELAELSPSCPPDVAERLALVRDKFMSVPRNWDVFTDFELHFELRSGKYELKTIERPLVDGNDTVILTIDDDDLRKGMNFWVRGIIELDRDEPEN